MGEHFAHLYFYSDKQIDKRLVSNVIHNCLKCGLEYEGKYWVRGNVESTTNKSLNDAIEEVAKCEGEIYFCHDGITPKEEIAIGFYNNEINDNLINISVRVWEYLFDDDINGKNSIKNGDTLLELAKSLYYAVQPIYGYWDLDISFHWISDYTEDPEIPKQLETLKIRGIYWVNFLSYELVEKIGREKLLSLPSWKTEELEDGGILLVLGPTPYNLRVKREEVEKYLGFR